MNIESIKEQIVAATLTAIILAALTVFYNFRKSAFLYFKRCKIKYFPTAFNVALSIQFNTEFNTGIYFNEIKKNIFRTIQEMNLGNILKIKDFSDIFLFKDQLEAEKYRNKENLDLIVWGNFSRDGLKINGELVSKINLNFTYGYPSNIRDEDNNLGKAIVLDISSGLAQKNYWQIVENNSLIDINTVSNNLTDIALYIVAITLKLYGRLEESQEILEKLYLKIFVQENSFKNQVKLHLIDCYTLFIIDIVKKRRNFEKGILYCKKLLEFDKNNFFAMCNLPFFLYKINQKDSSEKAVEELLKFYPNEAITEVDVAFIRILQKNYKAAYKFYNKVANRKIVDFNYQEVIEFLSEEYDENKEFAFLFASGLLSFVSGNLLLAKKDLKRFIKYAQESEYKPMLRKAKSLYKIIKNHK